MTLTALNVVSIVISLALVAGLVAAFVHLRREVEDAEGAIAVVELDEGPLTSADR